MKKLIYLLMLVGMATMAQVGINNTNPQETLHVSGTLRVDTLDVQPYDEYVVVDPDGKFYKRTLPVTGGNAFALQEITLQMSANYTVPIVPNVTYFDDDLNLNLNNVVTVNDGDTALITVWYDVPIGIWAGTNNDIVAYAGITFYRNGSQVEVASRKMNFDKDVTVTSGTTTTNIFRVGSVKCMYSEIVNDVADGNPTLVSYSARGYVEYYLQSDTGDPISILFGRFVPPDNYNWGIGFMKVRILIF